MANIILSDMTASITELKRHPMATVNKAHGAALAILNHNEPVFYCVPSQMYESMVDIIEDIHLGKIVEERKGQKKIKVNINDL